MAEAEEVDVPSLVDLLQHTSLSRHSTAPTFSSAPISSYLDHLVSLPLPNLVREPSLIALESSAVESELVNLCFREYSTFVSVHKCSAAVQSAFDDFDSSLKRLIDSVPALEDECRTFSNKTHSLQAVRGRALLVQEHEDKLLDLLEIPQLMDTCVRNGYYQEAQELSTHADSLKVRYKEITLVQDVAKEVQAVIQLMLSQLLALLREPVKLPTLVKAVTFLRRLGTIDEPDLGLVFLTSRLYNFRAQLVQIERDRGDPARYLRKYIDLFREHVYDIISQYTTIFNDPTQLVSFASQCVSDLVQLTAKYIPRIGSDSAAMSSVLVQLGYCALSFARVGMDFASLVTEPFSSTVLAAYSSSVSSASETFSKTLKNAVKNAALPSDTLVTSEYLPQILSATSLSYDPSDDQPPTQLSRFPPLALLFNAHVSAINALRLLAPVHLFPQIRDAQSASLVESSLSVLQYLDRALSSELPNGRPKHNRAPSSPRAHLLRRNTETQMTVEVRAARRKEAVKVCVAFAESWRYVAVYLTRILQQGVFESDCQLSPELEAKLNDVAAWIIVREESAAVNGAVEETKSRTSSEVPDGTSSPSNIFDGYCISPTSPTAPALSSLRRESSLNISPNLAGAPEEPQMVVAEPSEIDAEPPQVPPSLSINTAVPHSPLGDDSQSHSEEPHAEETEVGESGAREPQPESSKPLPPTLETLLASSEPLAESSEPLLESVPLPSGPVEETSPQETKTAVDALFAPSQGFVETDAAVDAIAHDRVAETQVVPSVADDSIAGEMAETLDGASAHLDETWDVPDTQEAVLDETLVGESSSPQTRTAPSYEPEPVKPDTRSTDAKADEAEAPTTSEAPSRSDSPEPPTGLVDGGQTQPVAGGGGKKKKKKKGKK